jgi:hypothetical protein
MILMLVVEVYLLIMMLFVKHFVHKFPMDISQYIVMNNVIMIVTFLLHQQNVEKHVERKDLIDQQHHNQMKVIDDYQYV